MPIQKKGDVEIQASASGAKVKQTGYTFYSYDKNAAALYFKFREQDGQPTDLGKATVHLVMILNDDNGKKFIPGDDEIEVLSAIRGTAKYVLPEMLLSYEGKVTGYVYMNFDDGSRSDDGQFTFRIRHSMITHVLPELGDKYVRDFEDVKEQVEQAADGAKETISQKVTEVSDTSDSAISKVNQVADDTIKTADQAKSDVQSKASEASEDILGIVKTTEDARDNAKSQIGDYVGEVESAKDSAVEDIDKALLVDEAKNYTDDKVEEFNETITTQLAETEKQVDFIELLHAHNVTTDKIYTKIDGEFDVSAVVPFSQKQAATYRFRRPPIDGEEYILFQEGYVSDIAKSKTVIDVGDVVNKDFDSRTGTWYDQLLGDTLPNSNNYASDIGATMTVSFIGDKIDFHHYARSDGGVWEFVLDGDTGNPVLVSTYNETSLQKTTATLWDNLPVEAHTVVGTFIGDDPDNVPIDGAGTSRGWIKYSSGGLYDDYTFTVYESSEEESTTVLNTKKFDALAENSNKEFALRVRPNGTSLDTDFIPGHVTTATVHAKDQRILIDGDEITNWTPTDYREAQTMQIIQKMDGFHPSDYVNPIADITSIHTVTSKGVSLKVKINFLTDLYCSTGYGLMFPVENTFGDWLYTNLGGTYQSDVADGSDSPLEENDRASSYAFVSNSSDKENYAVAMTVRDIARTFRYGKEDRNNPVVWLQHRDDYRGLQKMYTQPYFDAVIPAGDTFEVSGSFYIGSLPYAKELLKVSE